MSQEALDLRQVRAAIARLIPYPDNEDKSLGPLFIRLSWHNAGTWCNETKTGGTNGCTMRFDAEKNDPENNGLDVARDALEPIKEEFPFLSYADIYALAGTVAIEYMGGPKIVFATGRVDLTEEDATSAYGEAKCPFGDGAFNPNRSRLPASDIGPDPTAPEDAPIHVKEAPTIDAVRGTFTRLGLDDKEAVCLLLLGHQFGRCHLESSGHEAAWFPLTPTKYSNDKGGYTKTVQQAKIYKEVITPAGKRQFEADQIGIRHMLLPSDMVLVWDAKYKEHLDFYTKKQKRLFKDSATTWKKLIEFGCDGMLVDEQTEFDD